MVTTCAAAPRRHQQRMREWATSTAPGEALDRRPLQPVPGEVQHADRDPRVDDVRRRARRAARSRSFHELENSDQRLVRRRSRRSSAAASSWTYSPTPVRCRSAGR